MAADDFRRSERGGRVELSAREFDTPDRKNRCQLHYVRPASEVPILGLAPIHSTHAEVAIERAKA